MRLTTQQIEAFAESWRKSGSRHSLAYRLGEFAVGARRLLPKTTAPPCIGRGLSMPAERFAQVVPELRSLIAARTKRGDGINIWSAAGLGTDERRNVAALARLWMRSSIGDLATEFLSAFLRRVNGGDSISLEGGYHVHTEFLPMGDAAHRVDLVIETDTTIIGIEAKIRAPADKEQLARYARELELRAGQKSAHLLIYLGPRMLENSCALGATWSAVSSAAREVARSASGNSRRLLLDFADHTSTFRS